MKVQVNKMRVSLYQKNKPKRRTKHYRTKIPKTRGLKRSLKKKNPTLTKHKNKPKFNKRPLFNKNKNSIQRKEIKKTQDQLNLNNKRRSIKRNFHKNNEKILIKLSKRSIPKNLKFKLKKTRNNKNSLFRTNHKVSSSVKMLLKL
jgi:hypothetical protein